MSEALSARQRLHEKLPSLIVEFTGTGVDAATQLSPRLFERSAQEIRRAPSANGLFEARYLRDRYYSSLPEAVPEQIRNALVSGGT